MVDDTERDGVSRGEGNLLGMGVRAGGRELNRK